MVVRKVNKMRRKKDQSKGKLYLAIFIAIIALVAWLGTRDLPSNSEEIAVDITEQVKAKK